VQPFGNSGVATECVLGTYLHGIFENENVRRAFVETVFERASVTSPRTGTQTKPSPYDRTANLLQDYVDLESLDVRNL
jgi:adenosylcobyric acid synthase